MTRATRSGTARAAPPLHGSQPCSSSLPSHSHPLSHPRRHASHATRPRASAPLVAAWLASPVSTSSSATSASTTTASRRRSPPTIPARRRSSAHPAVPICGGQTPLQDGRPRGVLAPEPQGLPRRDGLPERGAGPGLGVQQEVSRASDLADLVGAERRHRAQPRAQAGAGSPWRRSTA